MENSRLDLLKLDKQRLEIEKEINELTDFLTQPGMPGIEGNLIDKDGFPIAGVDLYAVRQARQKLIMKQNDLKNLMNIIETKMSKYFEDINKENKTEDELNINQNNNNYINKEEPIAIPVLEEKIQNNNFNIKKENEEISTKRVIDTIIKVNSTNYKIDIIFNSRLVNGNYLKFINSFGESAITAQKSRSINDLLYIYHLNQSKS